MTDTLPKYRVRVVGRAEELALVQAHHYSRKVVPNSVIKLGCYHGMKLVGVATFGRIINCVQLFQSDKNNRAGLELNRLVMVPEAPKNSESWFLMTCIRILRKQYPWLKYINTWADGMRCQGGIIYKACGFLYLRKIPVQGIYQLPDGSTIHQIAFDKVHLKRHYPTLRGIKGHLEKVQRVFGPSVTELKGGYQYHYVYLLDKKMHPELLLVPQPYEANAPVAPAVPTHQDAGIPTVCEQTHLPASSVPDPSTVATPSPSGG